MSLLGKVPVPPSLLTFLVPVPPFLYHLPPLFLAKDIGPKSFAILRLAFGVLLD